MTIRKTWLTFRDNYDTISVDKTMEALMQTEKEVAAINEWLNRGFEIEIYRKPDGVLNIKTVRKKRLIVE